MEQLITALLWFAVLGCALLGGLYFAFSTFIMTALERTGFAGVSAMNSINVVIVRSWFIVFFFGTTLASLALLILGLTEIDSPRGLALVLGGAVYVAGMTGVTMLFNVPLNNALANVTSESRTGMAIWKDYLQRWTRWNHVRTVSCLAAAALFLYALEMGTSLISL